MKAFNAAGAAAPSNIVSKTVVAAGAGWQNAGGAGQSYVPVDFKHAGAAVTTETAYVTSAITGTLRNDYSGWVGMQIVVGASPINVTRLGRMMAPGNSGVHAMKLVAAGGGGDVPGASTTVAMSGGIAGRFNYGTLASPVTLAAGATYFLVTQESAGGDQWYDYNSVVTTTAAGTVSRAVWGRGAGDWHSIGASGQSYVPVDFQYEAAVAAGPTTYVKSAVPGTLRNDYSGWVGMKIVVGPSPMVVSQLGRMNASGNQGVHSVKLVRASDGTDLPGGATTVTTSGGTAGQFQYAPLAGSVTLAAGATYFLVTQESAGGDRWHDYDSVVTTTAAGTVSAAVWGRGAGDWHTIGTSGQSYVPVDLKYTN